jgi:hypothetical protein
MMGETLHKAEVEIIARDAAAHALEKHAHDLPRLMKPTMYEVAETVARRNSEDFHKIFKHLFGLDTGDLEHVRDFHKDLYFLRDQRMSHEARRALLRREMLRSTVKYFSQALVAAALALFAIFGYSPPHP